MAGGMKRFQVSGLRFQVRRAAQPAFNLKLETRNLKPGAAALALAAMLAASPLGGAAQILNDPTRPPAGSYSSDAGDGAAGGPVLQSVMITPTERSALIGGERVKLGGKYGDARVTKITESEVVLRSASGTEILRMYPDVSIKAVEPAPSAGKKKPARKKRGPAADTQGKQG